MGLTQWVERSPLLVVGLVLLFSGALTLIGSQQVTNLFRPPPKAVSQELREEQLPRRNRSALRAVLGLLLLLLAIALIVLHITTSAVS